jgi:hypothetical protein
MSKLNKKITLDDLKEIWTEESIEITIEEIAEKMMKRGTSAENIEEDIKIDEKQVYTKVMQKSAEDCINKNLTEDYFEKQSPFIELLLYEFGMPDIREIYHNNGKIYTKKAIAEKMLKRGTPLEIIAEDTDLSSENVEKLAEKIYHKK